jgi:hypothetical protein
MQGERKSPLVGETIPAMIGAGLATADDFVGMVPEFPKRAGARCPHQRVHKGCMIYSNRPFCCRVWNCLWLVNDDTADLPRPDRCHYVIDIMPDVVRCVPNSGGEPFNVPAIQVWVDPGYPDAHRDPALRAYLERQSQRNGGVVAMIRYSETDGFILWPPSANDTGGWIEARGEMMHREHHLAPPEEWTKEPGDNHGKRQQQHRLSHADGKHA